MEPRHRAAIAALEIANKIHRAPYEWAAPDPRLDGKAVRPWDGSPPATRLGDQVDASLLENE